MEFKGTKGNLERKYVAGVCIGIGTVGFPSVMTANSILPETDNQYKEYKQEIESDMLLYSKAPEMLEMLKVVLEVQCSEFGLPQDINEGIVNLIKEATTIE